MFNYLQQGLSRLYRQFADCVAPLFRVQRCDEGTLKELERLLLSADTGVATTRLVLDRIRDKITRGEVGNGAQLREALHEILCALLEGPPRTTVTRPVTLLLGVNGSGKTTTAAKLARTAKNDGKQVLLVAADTFRAAATDQLVSLAKEIEVPVVCGKEGQDPASVVFAACQKYKNASCDTLIIDTAGRLQTNTSLLLELKKVVRIVNREAGHENVRIMLVLDSTIGQNSLEQARLFHEHMQVDEIIMSKMDGMGKGGILLAIANELKIPVAHLSYGQSLEDLKYFDAPVYVHGLLGT